MHTHGYTNWTWNKQEVHDYKWSRLRLSILSANDLLSVAMVTPKEVRKLKRLIGLWEKLIFNDGTVHISV